MPRFQQLRFFIARLHGMRGGRTELNCLGGLPLLEEIVVEYWCGHAAIDLGASFPTGAVMQPLLTYILCVVLSKLFPDTGLSRPLHFGVANLAC
jgi:hypothetical protein